MNKKNTKINKALLDKINRLPIDFNGQTATQCEFTVQTPHFWEVKAGKDVYHAAILFEDYPDGIHSASQTFISVFMVWKNNKIHYRQVIENNPEHIKITGWELCKNTVKDIYLSLNYDFAPFFESSSIKTGKCHNFLPVTTHFHASIKDFDLLKIGKLTIKNGIAGVPSSDNPEQPVFQLVFPHCYVVKNENHTFHITLVDRQHEDLLAVYIWKDRKPHSVYLLDHYEQFYFSPDRLKIESGPGAMQYKQTPAKPVWDSIFLRYTVDNYFGRPDSEFAPSVRSYKYNYVTIDLKNPGTYDMRKQQFKRGFEYSPQLK